MIILRATVERITVTLPNDLVSEIDRRDDNRGKFVVEAVRKELDYRRRAELRRSLENPHAECAALADSDLQEWIHALPDEDTTALLDINMGKEVRWISGLGWVEGPPAGKQK